MNEDRDSGRCRNLRVMNRFDAIEKQLWPKAGSSDVWMIVDCARDQNRIFRFLLACHLEQSCLYSGPIPPALEMAAPYLLQLQHDDPETRRLLEISWGNSWGVVLRSPTSMRNLRKHLRKLLMVRDQAGRRMAFRYYDPRILQVYLPTCTGEELRTVFGPIESFWTEHWNDPGQMLEFKIEGARLSEKSVSV